jgi:hypothetical protein
MISEAAVELEVVGQRTMRILLQNLVDYDLRGLALIVPIHAGVHRPRLPGAYGPSHQYCHSTGQVKNSLDPQGQAQAHRTYGLLSVLSL